jgi:hypothetical protein
MADQWYYSRSGQQLGPVTGSELRQLAVQGLLSPIDLIWREGLTDWLPASRIKGLFPPGPPPLPISLEATQPHSPPSPPLAGPAVPNHTLGLPGANASPAGSSPSATAPPIAAIFSGMHRQRLSIAIAAGAGMFATFLPWFHVPLAGAVTGSRGDGWITFFLFVPAAVLSLTGNRNNALTHGARLGAAIPSVISSLVAVISAVGNKTSSRDNPISAAIMEATDIGVGIFVVIAAGLAVAIFAWSMNRPAEGARS